MKKITSAIILICTLSLGALAQTNISGIINTYTKVTAFSNACSCPSTNCATVTVTSAAGFAANDIVMIIQMKGARADSSNTASHGTILNLYDAGNYEFDTIASIAGSVITLKIPLRNTYFTNATYADSAYVQLIKVPVYTDANVNGTLRPAVWNPGTGTGGVLVFIVTGTLTLNSNISADTAGFSGAVRQSGPTTCTLDTAYYYQSTTWQHTACTGCGYSYGDTPTRWSEIASFGGCGTPYNTNRMMTVDLRQGGFRGEGIVANTFQKVGLLAPFNVMKLNKGRARWGNGGGGGGNHNAGGGGGGNYGAGGYGGNAFNSTACDAGTHAIRRGMPAVALTPTGSKIFMGGGGGEGHDNGGNGSTGTRGGGIIIIKAATVTNGASYTISANGKDNTILALGDGSGGGGAGGTILMNVTGSYTNAVTISAKGGFGGSHINPNCHGTGGGGGGGVIWFSQSSTPANVTTVVTGGANGVQTAATPDCGSTGTSYGATPGANGGVLYNTDASSMYFLNMNDCNFSLPVELVSFSASVSENGVQLHWSTASEINSDHFTVERTEDLMTYSDIGSLPAAGNSSVSNEYAFRDDRAPAKELYYRLRQVDFDGKVHYPGKLVRINNQDAGRMPLISPIPNDGTHFTLNLSACDDREIAVEIVNNTGTIVWQQLFDLSYNNEKLVSINTGRTLNAGVYTVRVNCPSGQQTKRFLVARKEE